LDANFSGGQVWVNSKPRNWRPTKKKSAPDTSPSDQVSAPWAAGDSRGASEARIFENQAVIDSLSPLKSYPIGNDQIENGEASQETYQFHDSDRLNGHSPNSPSRLVLTSNAAPPTSIHEIEFSPGSESAARYLETSGYGHIVHSNYQTLTRSSTATTHDVASPSSSSRNDLAPAPREALQEACLLRYFIEELSPWVRSKLIATFSDEIDVSSV
jgi:hypothetical protein